MSTCDELYESNSRGFVERIVDYTIGHVNKLARTITHMREDVVRNRRLRATELALDGLPEDLRCDIGWPDLYERQIRACNK